MISILLRLHKCESYSSNDKYNNNAKETIKGRLRIEKEPFVFRVIRHHLLRDKERLRWIQAAGGDRVEGEEQGKSTRYKQGETRAAGAWLYLLPTEPVTRNEKENNIRNVVHAKSKTTETY
jgi:hypothetical protein